jgi:NMDA receptor-regulated protein 1
VTLRAYLRVLRFCDAVYEHAFFERAAQSLVRMYVHLYDYPPSDGNDFSQDFDNMNSADRKKAKAVARKKKKETEKKQQQQQQVEEEKSEHSENGGGATKNGKTDPDPAGLTYMKKDPLEEAHKFSQMLSRYSPDAIESWSGCYDVAVRRKKPLMAMRACLQGQRLCPALMMVRIIDFLQTQHKCGDDSIPDAAKLVLKEEMSRLTMGYDSLQSYVNAVSAEVLADPKSALDERIGIAQALLVFDPQSATSVFERCLVGSELAARKVTVETIQQAVALVKHYKVSGKAMEWATSMLQVYPDAGRRIPRTKRLVSPS